MVASNVKNGKDRLRKGNSVLKIISCQASRKLIALVSPKFV